MTGNMKAFLKKLSGNNELAEKAAKLDKESLIALAKELGFELTEADFVQPEGEISENEMDAVVGGYKQCVCAYGGGGAEDDQGNKCVCVVWGTGRSKETNKYRCGCFGAGHGDVEAWELE